MPDETVGLLLTAEQIGARVAELGAEISRDYAGKTPILIGVLKGSLVFMADLARAITTPINVDFMSISSYGDGTNSGVVRILKDLDESITGHDVILVEGGHLQIFDVEGNAVTERRHQNDRTDKGKGKPDRITQQLDCFATGVGPEASEI